MAQRAQTTSYEPRWPAALAILATLFLLESLSARIRLLPVWFPYLAVAVVLVPMAATSRAPTDARWLRVERTITFLFSVMVGAVTILGLANMTSTIVFHPKTASGIELLASSVALWVTNVVAFSLLYWHLDRGGPNARTNGQRVRPDWFFPQTERPEDVPPDWQPVFVDYLFLGFSTATAFSTTDVLPLTPRAKMLMMIESTISLAAIAIVAARAINILGT